MFQFDVTHQKEYSPGEAILRALFAPIYIWVPHIFVLFFMGIGVNFAAMIAWFSVLFTGKYPRDVFDFIVGYYRWSARLYLSISGLVDGYPAFSLKAHPSDKFTFEVEYKEERSQGQLLLITFLGVYYILLPHYFVLLFVSIWSGILSWLGFWSVLFTGKFPPQWHITIVNYYRWYYRVGLYYFLIIPDKYPPFSGLPENQIVS